MTPEKCHALVAADADARSSRECVVATEDTGEDFKVGNAARSRRWPGNPRTRTCNNTVMSRGF